MAEQRTVYFSGEVQGVGFRATTERLARSMAVTGYVRNLPDGRVELLAEGEPAEIDRLLAAVRDAFQENLTDETSRTDSVTGDYDRFAVRY